MPSKKKAKRKSNAGRPKIPINWEEFDKLCAMQCTQEEIADWFDCSVDTIDRRVKEVKDCNFAEYFSKKRSVGKISLRRTQFQMAMNNVTMSIWLGKQYLGQRDRHDVYQENVELPSKKYDLDKMTPEEYRDFIKGQILKDE